MPISFTHGDLPGNSPFIGYDGNPFAGFSGRPGGPAAAFNPSLVASIRGRTGSQSGQLPNTSALAGMFPGLPTGGSRSQLGDQKPEVATKNPPPAQTKNPPPPPVQPTKPGIPAFSQPTYQPVFPNLDEIFGNLDSQLITLGSLLGNLSAPGYPPYPGFQSFFAPMQYGNPYGYGNPFYGGGYGNPYGGYGNPYGYFF